MFSVIEHSLNLDAVKLDALYLVKLIFGEYFCYFDSNCVSVLLQLQLYLDTNRVLVRERVNIIIVLLFLFIIIMTSSSSFYHQDNY